MPSDGVTAQAAASTTESENGNNASLRHTTESTDLSSRRTASFPTPSGASNIAMPHSSPFSYYNTNQRSTLDNNSATLGGDKSESDADIWEESGGGSLRPAHHLRAPKTPAFLPQNFSQLWSVLPGVLMVLMFGYTYVAIVTAGNPGLKAHAGFFLGWAQISNISISLAAGLIGSTNWAIGGANTTSAILLQALLKDSNFETALVIQGTSSLFTALAFILSAQFGGIGRLFGDKNPDTAMYADYIHPSLVMATAQATALLMVKYSLELAVEGNPLALNGNWWSEIFSPEALSIWLPAWAIGGFSAILDMRLQRQGMAMCLLLVVPLVTFIIVAAVLGLENIPSHYYWEMSSASASFQTLDFSLVDGVEVARKLPISAISSLVIFVEALVVYKSYSVVVPERRSVKADTMSCGVAHVFIALLGGWFGHQTFVESITNHRAGFRWSYLGGLIEFSLFGGFAAAVFVLDSPPAFPTIVLSATVFYLACVFFDSWFLQRLPPVMTAFEWMLSTTVVVCVLVFGYNLGMAIGVVFSTLLVYSTKKYAYVVKQVDYDPRSAEMQMVLHGHISHGNTTEVFDLILEAPSKPGSVSIDMTQVTSADSAMALFLHSLSLMSTLESIHFIIRHCFPEGSNARETLNIAAGSSCGMLECIVLDIGSAEESTMIGARGHSARHSLTSANLGGSTRNILASARHSLTSANLGGSTRNMLGFSQKINKADDDSGEEEGEESPVFRRRADPQ